MFSPKTPPIAQAPVTPLAAPQDVAPGATMAGAFGLAEPAAASPQPQLSGQPQLQNAAAPADMSAAFGVAPTTPAAPQPAPEGGNTLDYLASGANRGIAWTADLPFQAAKIVQDLVLPKATPTIADLAAGTPPKPNYIIPPNPVSDYFAKKGWVQPDNGGDNFIHQAASAAGNFIAGGLLIGLAAKATATLGQLAGRVAPSIIHSVEELLPAAGGEAAQTIPAATAVTRGAAPSAGRLASGTQKVVESMVPTSAGGAAIEAGTAAVGGASSVYAKNVGVEFSRLMGGDQKSQDAMGELFANMDAVLTGSWQGIVRNAKHLLGSAGKSLLTKVPGGSQLMTSASENMTEAGRAAGANNKVVEMLTPPLLKPGVDEALTAGGAAQDATGANHSLGEQTGSQGLIDAQTALQKRMTADQLAEEATRQATNQRLAENYTRNVTPALHDAAGNVIANPQNGNLHLIIDKARKTIQSVGDSAQAAMASLGAKITSMSPSAAAASGNYLRAKLAEVRTAVRDSFAPQFAAIKADPNVLNEAYQRTGNKIISDFMGESQLVNASKLPPALKDLKSDMDRLNAAEAKGGDTASLADVMAGKVRTQQAMPDLTIKDLMYRRQQIADAQRDMLTGANPDNNAARILANAKKQLDTMLDQLPIGTEYQALRKDYRENYIDRFENDTAFKIDSQNGRGQYQTMPEHVASLGIATDDAGGYTKAMQFKAAYGADPMTSVHMHNAIQDDFYNAAVRDGKIDATKAAEWVRTHQGGTLAVYPEAMPNPQTLATRQAELDETAKSLGKDSLATEISKVTRGKTTVDEFMQKAIDNDALGIKLWNAVKGDPAAEEAYIRHLFSNAPKDQSLDAFLNRPVVKAALSPEHIANLRKIAKSDQMVAAQPSLDVPINVDPFSAVQKATGLTAQSILSRGYAYGRQVIGAPWLITDGVARAFQALKSTHTQELLQRALYNPDLARDLVAAGRRAGTGPLSAAGTEKVIAPLRNWLVFYGLEPASVRK